MIPIHELLQRVRWDTAYAAGHRFVIGYYDRMTRDIVEVPFTRVHFDPDDHFAFEVTDRDGIAHQVPYHRVRSVYRDGKLIWQRPGRA